jgi:hypothetical protein
MRSRTALYIMLLFLLAASVVALPGLSRAQDGAPPLCGSLAEADCAILEAAMAKLAALQSAAFELSLTVAQTENGEPGSTTALRGQGRLSSDFGTLASLPETTPDGLSVGIALLNELAAGPTPAFRDLLSGSQGDLTVQATITPDAGATPLVFDFDLALVDSVLYIRSGSGGDWFSLDLAATANELAAGGALVDVTTDGLTSLLGSDLLRLLFERTSWEGRAVVARLPDERQDGQTLAVFETTVKLGEVVRSQEFQAGVAAALAGQSSLTGRAAISLRGLEQAALRLAADLQDAQIVVTQWVGLDNEALHRARTVIRLDGTARALTVTLAVDLSALDEPVEVTPPVGD